MVGHRSQAEASYETQVASLYDAAVKMKRETVQAADMIAGYACLFIFLVERLEKHPAIYAAVDAVFHAKGHPLGEMKRHCDDIRSRLQSYVTRNHPYA